MENTSVHNGRIYMDIAWNEHDLIVLVKMKPGKQWHPEQKRWSLPDTPDNRAWAGVQLAAAPIASYPVSPPLWPFVPATLLTKGPDDAATPLPQVAPPTPTAPKESATERTCWIADGRIYYPIPFSQIDKRLAIKKITGCSWHLDCKVWSVPDTDENRLKIKAIHYGQATGSSDSPIFIAVKKHPVSADYLCLDLPISMLNTHLSILKNIHGRRWDQQMNVWEVPYTQVTLRFFEKYLVGCLHWTMEPESNRPERLTEAERPVQYAPKPTIPPPRYEAAVTALENPCC